MPVPSSCRKKLNRFAQAQYYADWLRCPDERDPKRRFAMGDKGKKDKEKNRKQKVVKQVHSAKLAREKFVSKFPLQKT